MTLTQGSWAADVVTRTQARARENAAIADAQTEAGARLYAAVIDGLPRFLDVVAEELQAAIHTANRALGVATLSHARHESGGVVVFAPSTRDSLGIYPDITGPTDPAPGLRIVSQLSWRQQVRHYAFTLGAGGELLLEVDGRCEAAAAAGRAVAEQWLRAALAPR